MTPDRDQGVVRSTLVERAARIATDVGHVLSDNPNDRALRRTRRNLRLAYQVVERVLEASARVDRPKSPDSSFQRELLIRLLARADRGESLALRASALEIYEKRGHDDSRNQKKVIGGITGRISRTTNVSIEDLQHYLSEPELPIPRTRVGKMLDVVHTVPGHEAMNAQELLDFMMDVKAAAEPKRKRELPYGERTKSVVLARLRPNETRTGRAHKTWNEVVEKSDTDLLADVPESERGQKIRDRANNARGTVNVFIRMAGREDTNSHAHHSISMARSVLPEVRALCDDYSRLTDAQIFEMLKDPRLFPKIDGVTGEVQLVRVVETKPVMPLREELVIGLLRRADQGESLDLLDLAHEIYEKRPHDNSISEGASIRALVAGLVKTRTAVVERLEQYSPDQHLLRINAYVERILDVAHTVSGHKAMIARELLDFLIETEKFVPPATGETVERCASGDRLKRNVFASFESNSDNTDLRYKSPKEKTEAAISDLLEGRSRRKQGELIKSHMGGLKTTIERFVRILRESTTTENKDTQERYRQILTEVRARWPEAYGNANDEEMIAILAGETPFPDIFNKRPGLLAGINEAFGELFIKLSSPSPATKQLPILPTRPETNIHLRRKRGTTLLPHATVWQRPGTQERPGVAEIAPAPATQPPEPEKRRIKTELERIEDLYGNRKPRVLLSLIERNEDLTNFRFPTINQTVEEVYGDVVAKSRNALTFNQKFAEIKHAFAIEREYYVQILTDYVKQPDDGPDKEIAEALLKEAADRLGYDSEVPLSPVRLIRILRRHIEFTDIYNPDPKFDKAVWNEDGDTIITKETQLDPPGKTGKDAGGQVIRSHGDDGITAAFRESRIAIQD